ncbi:MAG: sugar phosphate nucleotidyltransferase [Candidatus Bathyarchaeia archaeon]
MKAVILAAGRGVRLQPLTENKPKQMLPVAGKPIIGHILDSLRSIGIEKVLIVVGNMGEALQGYVESLKLPFQVEYIQQLDPRGTGHAAAIAAERIPAEHFLLLYGDVIPSPTMLELVLERYEELNLALIAVSWLDDFEGFGVIQVSDGLLDRIEEKPSKLSLSGGLVNVGIYVLTSDVLRDVEEVGVSPRGEIELTDALNISASRGRVGVVQVSQEEWVHIGYPWDLLRANMKLLSGISTSILGDVEENVKVSGPVVLGEDSVVKAGSTIEGPAFIGERATVGPNAYIRRFTFLDRDVRVGNACEVKNSIIMEGTRIPHLSYVGDSVIGCNCNIGAGTMIANLRFDEAYIKSTVKGERVSTGERKFGAVIGDNVRTGVNVSLMPGVKIGYGSWIGPGTVVSEDVPPRTLMSSEQKLKYVGL